jgi:Flp pilus assembly protein TadD
LTIVNRCAGLLALVCLAGCASGRGAVAAPPGDTLSDYIGRVRQISARASPSGQAASPGRGRTVRMLEQQDTTLAAALRDLAAQPSAGHHLAVAASFWRLGIVDLAFDHYSRASRMAPGDARAYEGLARVWRDWGLAHLGLGDAYRAVHHAPGSASARNTLGTLLQDLGRLTDARTRYREALSLDAGAAYAMNNLCYVSFLQRKTADAEAWCRSAVAADPTLVAARNNLALVVGRSGTAEAVRETLGPSASPGQAEIRLGVAFLANARFAEAAEAFERAAAIEPTGESSRLAAQAREMARRSAAEAGHR